MKNLNSLSLPLNSDKIFLDDLKFENNSDFSLKIHLRYNGEFDISTFESMSLLIVNPHHAELELFGPWHDSSEYLNEKFTRYFLR